MHCNRKITREYLFNLSTKQELLDILEELNVSDLEKAIMFEHYINRKAFKEIFKEVGTTRSWCSSLHSRVLSKIYNKHLENIEEYLALTRCY